MTANLNPTQYEITSGYIGSCGKTYETATAQTLAEAVSAASKLSGKTEEEISQLLDSGKPVEWRESPNYYYDHSMGTIRKIRVETETPETHWSGTRYDERCEKCRRTTDVCNDCGRCENCH
jgi:uncharacterized protein YvpB